MMKSLIIKFLMTLFYPLSWLYEAIYKVRRFCFHAGIFKRNSFCVPIISVGNLTFGGTGKTPFTIWLGNYFSSKNLKVMVMMRGHKGSLENKYGILKTDETFGRNPYEYGDEALVLARRLTNSSIVVGKNRSENLNYYFDQELPDIVILDDGHQHLKLKRDLNFVLFDCLLDIKKLQVPPFGYLREGLTALEDANIAVLGRSNQVDNYKKNELKALIKKYNPHIPILEIGYRAKALYHTDDRIALELNELKGKKIICFSGIASPESFFKLLRSFDADIIYSEAFPDHHYFTGEQINELLLKAKENDAVLVTTEKDMVKLRRITDSDDLLFLQIGIEFFQGEEELKNLLDRTFSKK